MKGVFWKALSTAFVWVMITGAIALMSIFLAPELADDVIIPILFVLVAGVITNGFIWDWGRGTASAEDKQQNADTRRDEDAELGKRKRRDSSIRLQDYTDTELIKLRERVMMGDIDERELEKLLDG